MSKQYSSYTVEEANKKVPVVVDSEDLSVHAKVGRSSKLKWSGVLWGFLFDSFTFITTLCHSVI